MHKLVNRLLFTAFLINLVLAGVTGKIMGTVTVEETGAALQGVNVFLIGKTLGASTNQNGEFIILNVPPGEYTLKATMIGYGMVSVEKVLVSIDLTTMINIKLSVETLEGEEIIITAERKLLREDEFTSRHSVTAEEIDVQPVDNFIEIAQNQAGVVGTHFRGGRSSEILVVVDGIPMRDPAGTYSGNIGGFTASIPEQAIQELEITLGGFGAEYGNVQSGVLNLALKEGDHKFHGRFRVSSTNFGESLNNTLMGERDTWGGTFHRYLNEDSVWTDTLDYGNKYQHKLMTIYQFGLSGPVAGLANFSLSGEITDKPQGYFINQQSFNQSYQGKVTLKLSPKMKLAIGGLYSTSTWDQFYFPASKYGPAPDYPVNEYIDGVEDSTLIRYEYVTNPYDFDQNGVMTGEIGLLDTLYYDSTLTYYVGGMQEYLWDRTKQNTTGYAVFTHSITSRTYYELRYQSAYSSYKYSTVDVDDRDSDGNTAENLVWDDSDTSNVAHPIYRERTDNYWWIRGDDPGFRDQESWSNTFKGDITSQVTFNHMLKAGFELGLHRTKVENISWTLGYGTFRQDIWDQNTLDFGTYIQDKMEFKGITALIGLRWDLFNPNGLDGAVYYPVNYSEPKNLMDYYDDGTSGLAPSDTTFKKASVRSQFSPWIGISHPITDRDVLHFTYGHYFQRPDGYYLYRNFKIQSLTKVGNYVGNPDLKPEKTVSYDFGVEHLFTNDVKLSVTGYYKDISNLMDWYKYSTNLQGKELNVYTNVDYGNVKGLELSFIKLVGSVWGCSVNYTYSIARGRSSSPNEGAGTFSAAKKMVILDFDQTHTMNANITLQTPAKVMEPLANWRANFQVKYGSGLPYTSSGSDVVNDARLPEKLNVDLRLNKRIPLPGTVSMDIFIDVRNLFNRENVDRIGSSSKYSVTGDYSVIRLREDTGELVRNPKTLNEERQFRFGLAAQF
ncbi:MAG: TonB-dependent receptor [Candidatus Marinimicrobia bacterium]|nr:TonB-dependent receptor [Candidatus Neomarinimicrobiota bacterium]